MIGRNSILRLPLRFVPSIRISFVRLFLLRMQAFLDPQLIWHFSFSLNSKHPGRRDIHSRQRDLDSLPIYSRVLCTSAAGTIHGSLVAGATREASFFDIGSVASVPTIQQYHNFSCFDMSWWMRNSAMSIETQRDGKEGIPNTKDYIIWNFPFLLYSSHAVQLLILPWMECFATLSSQ